MPKPQQQKSVPTTQSAEPAKSLPAAALLSFLKESRGTPIWTEEDLAKALNLGLTQASQAVAVLQLQGYIEPGGNTGKWRTTQEGEIVSGAKSPRFTPESVREALADLHDRIQAVNADQNATYKVTAAVAFGDFLRDQARVQAADVGIRIARKLPEEAMASARERAAELVFLKQLRGKTAVLHVHPYEEWMSARSHEPLL